MRLTSPSSQPVRLSDPIAALSKLAIRRWTCRDTTAGIWAERCGGNPLPGRIGTISRLAIPPTSGPDALTVGQTRSLVVVFGGSPLRAARPKWFGWSSHRSDRVPRHSTSGREAVSRGPSGYHRGSPPGCIFEMPFVTAKISSSTSLIPSSTRASGVTARSSHQDHWWIRTKPGTSSLANTRIGSLSTGEYMGATLGNTPRRRPS
jgi:hypothetical protein